MATILSIKADIDRVSGKSISLVFEGATEAHILVHELAKAKVGVIISGPRSYPGSWDTMRIVSF